MRSTRNDFVTRYKPKAWRFPCLSRKVIVSTLVIIIVNLAPLSTPKPPIKKLEKIRCTKDELGNDDCTCPPEPLTERYPDVKDITCDWFYLCHLGKALKMRCPPRNAFHPKLNECIPRTRIPVNICKPLVNCPFRPNRYVEDSNDCSKYYLCFFGEYSHWSCPEDTYFEPNQEKCVSDKMQADACIKVARRNYYETVGFEKPPPKTSVALDKAKAYIKSNNKTKTKKG